MSTPPDTGSEPAPFDDENTDGAARFEQATRAARDLAALTTDRPDPVAAADASATASPTVDRATEATPLQPLRVVFLVAVMVVTWFSFMLWDTWGG